MPVVSSRRSFPLAVDIPQSLSARDFRDTLVFQRRVVASRNTRGEDVYSWVTTATANAHVSATQGNEFQAAQQRWAEVRFVARMHYNVMSWEPKRADRVLWGTRVLDLLDIEDPWGTRQWCVAYFKELVQ